MIDFDLNNNGIVIENDVDLVLQQIDILFDTSPREVLGDEDFGTEYDKCLYDLNMSNDELRRRVETDLRSIDLLGFEYHVDVHMLRGTEQDIALVEINLIQDGVKYNRIYKIS